MTTLLAIFRRPEGDDAALATLERRYVEEHLPLVAGTPGLRSMAPGRVVATLAGDDGLAIVTAMTFDDRASLDAAMASEAMRAGGRNLREIAPGLLTLVVLEDLPA